jgi:hypothetical protein
MNTILQLSRVFTLLWASFMVCCFHDVICKYNKTCDLFVEDNPDSITIMKHSNDNTQ